MRANATIETLCGGYFRREIHYRADSDARSDMRLMPRAQRTTHNLNHIGF
jgi:hypothetical protein